MIKEIELKGITTVPSDYTAPDGTLAASLNLINERGALRPIVSPKVEFTLPEGYRLLLAHSVPGQVNYLVSHPAGSTGEALKIGWFKKVDNAGSDFDVASAVTDLEGTFSGITGVAIVGNTIAMTHSDGMFYFLWYDLKYIPLGERPPFIAIDFGLCETIVRAESETSFNETFELPRLLIPGSGAYNPSSANKAGYQEALDEFSMHVHALINSYSVSNITSKGYFWMPFFIRYAYRLFDGTYNWHSAPILMIPTAYPPKITYSATDEGVAHIGFVNKAFTLVHRILTDGIEELKKWENIVSGIDVFVSAPIYTYDQSKNMQRGGLLSLTLSEFALRNSVVRGNTSGLSEASGTHRGRSGDSSRATATSFDGHYAARESNGVLVAHNSPFIDHALTGRDGQLINIPPHEKFTENLVSCHEYYKIAEIDIKNIAPMEDIARLKLIDNNLTNLVTRPSLPDDFSSHRHLKPETLFAYNNRLALAGLKYKPATPFPIRSMIAMSNGTDSVACREPVLKVWIRSGGKKVLAVNRPVGSIEANTFYNSATSFPRWLYYPDVNAYKMEVYCSDTVKYTVNLTPHDFLNGAYYYGGMNPESLPDNTEPETDPTVDEMEVSSMVYSSEVNNPFSFPARYATQVGDGKVVALSTAAKALSQGQFGQFPLYAFTTAGVWALELDSTGVFVARQPITRDVCLSPDGICQLDSSVLFATSRGIMQLAGSQASCISAVLDNEYPFNLMKLSHISNLAKLAGINDSALREKVCAASFPAFLADARMVYDYPHQRIYVYSPSQDFAFVLSPATSLWGMALIPLRYGVNSYPEALAVDSSNRILNFAEYSDVVPKGLMVTRPLKLDTPDVLKTIDTAIVRGEFARGKVATVLYGSSDLVHWHLVWTSKDHYLRGFHGTPYKYYRIAIVARLNADESIYGASVQFATRMTNQLR